MLQTALIQEANGVSGAELEQVLRELGGILDVIRKAEDPLRLPEDLAAYLKHTLEEHPDMVPEGMAMEEIVNSQVKAMATPWMHYFISYDPAPVLRKVQCPVLALNGEKDLQVPPSENLEAIEKHLEEGGNTEVETRMLPGLNHLFQKSDTGSPAEYGSLEETFSPAALEVISNWILRQTE